MFSSTDPRRRIQQSKYRKQSRFARIPTAPAIENKFADVSFKANGRRTARNICLRNFPAASSSAWSSSVQSPANLRFFYRMNRTGNLDSANGEAVVKLLTDLHQARSTICMVTHDQR